MAALVLVGGLLWLAAWLLDAPWLYWVGAVPIGVAPSGLLVPAFRTSAGRPGSSDYRDADFIGAGMHVAGFSTKEIADASNVAQEKRRGPGSGADQAE